MSSSDSRHRSTGTRAGYNLWANAYDSTPNSMVAMVDIAIARTWPAATGLDVLEVGCGTGRHLHRLWQAGAARLTGLDFSEEMLRIARGRLESAPVELLQHDIRAEWPVADDRFDVVLFSLVLEHVQDLDPVMREAVRVCRRGGRIHIFEIDASFFARGKQARFDHGGKRVTMQSTAHTAEELIAALETAGATWLAKTALAPCTRVVELEPRAAKHRGISLVTHVSAQPTS